uniref:Uncharacterized protein n=1 Tax=Phlebotomus papatasi TaxID=29031 RepID=A0A1B0DM05_PHLPP
MGVSICVIFPALCFKRVAKKDSTEKSAAQFMCVFGFVLMILGTYANLSAIDEKKSGPIIDNNDLNDMRIQDNVREMLPEKIPEPKLPESMKEDREITEKVRPPDLIDVGKESIIQKDTIEKEVDKSEVREKEKILDADAIMKEDREIAVEDSGKKHDQHDHEFHAIAGKIDNEKNSKENIPPGDPAKPNDSSPKLEVPKAEDHRDEVKIAEEPVKIPEPNSRERLIQNITNKFPNPIPIALLPNASQKHDEVVREATMPKNRTLEVPMKVPEKILELPKLMDTVKATIEAPVEKADGKPELPKEEVKKDQPETSKENVDTIRRDLLGVNSPSAREKRNVGDQDCERDLEQL